MMHYLSIMAGFLFSSQIDCVTDRTKDQYTIMLSICDDNDYLLHKYLLNRNELATHTQEGKEFVFFPKQIVSIEKNDPRGQIFNLLITGTEDKQRALAVLRSYTQDRLEKSYGKRSLS